MNYRTRSILAGGHKAAEDRALEAMAAIGAPDDLFSTLCRGGYGSPEKMRYSAMRQHVWRRMREPDKNGGVLSYHAIAKATGTSHSTVVTAMGRPAAPFVPGPRKYGRPKSVVKDKPAKRPYCTCENCLELRQRLGWKEAA